MFVEKGMAKRVTRKTGTPEEHYQYMLRIGIGEAEARAIAGLVEGEWIRASEAKALPLTPEELAEYDETE